MTEHFQCRVLLLVPCWSLVKKQLMPLVLLSRDKPKRKRLLLMPNSLLKNRQGELQLLLLLIFFYRFGVDCYTWKMFLFFLMITIGNKLGVLGFFMILAEIIPFERDFLHNSSARKLAHCHLVYYSIKNCL